MFPFRFKIYTDAGRDKYIHVACLFIGILVPFAPVVASISKSAMDAANAAGNETSAADLLLSDGLGFKNFRYPPILCNMRYKVVIFYSLVLPMILIQATGTTLIIAITWHIRRVCTLVFFSSKNLYNSFES